MERKPFLRGESIKSHQTNWENIKNSLVYKGKTKRLKNMGQMHLGAQPTSDIWTTSVKLLPFSWATLLFQANSQDWERNPFNLLSKRPLIQWTISFWKLQALLLYLRARAFQEGSSAPVPQILQQLYRWENWHSLNWPWQISKQSSPRPLSLLIWGESLHSRHTSSSKLTYM